MTGEFSSTWLTLREPADAAARDTSLVAALRERLTAPSPPAAENRRKTMPLVVRDLGCGTGSLGRWLAPRLPVPQHWVLMDRDPDLLAHAAAHLPDGVTAETRQGDVTGLSGDDLAGTSLVTCSALLDLLTEAEVGALAAACAVHGTPVLFTLSVTGRVTLDPADPLDGEIAAAFNAHQRRSVDGRRLLGPDATDAAVTAFRAHGATVTVRDSPWRIAPGDPLGPEWLRGWLDAAYEQSHDIRLDRYRRSRSGREFSATVGHADLLATFD